MQESMYNERTMQKCLCVKYVLNTYISVLLTFGSDMMRLGVASGESEDDERLITETSRRCGRDFASDTSDTKIVW